MSLDVRLGYAVGSGEPVDIPIAHMVVTGQTQLAGKTTTLEALVARSNRRAYAFVTKRGEQSFANGRRIAPYLRERADWQFVQSVLEATMRERMKFERAWIMRASKGAKTLADVQRNVRLALADKKTRGLSADVYMTLDAYLDIVVPRLSQVRFAKELDLHPGLNVVDMADRERFPAELQSLVIRSTIEYIYEVCQDTMAIIPEAWEWLPQSRGSPVKLAAIELIRKGAGLRNFVWLDSQDLGGIDKELLRSCSVWLLGIQREENEIKRTLGSIPAGVKKPKPADVALLERGQFFACWGRHVVKAYVQPAWMTDELAAAIARGEIDQKAVDAIGAQRKTIIDGARAELDELVEDSLPPQLGMPTRLAEDIAADVDRRILDDSTRQETDDMTPDQERKLDRMLELLVANAQHREPARSAVEGGPPATMRQPDDAGPGYAEEDALYERFKARLLGEPKVLAVAMTVPAIEIETKVERVTIDGKSATGKVALLIREGFFDTQRGATNVTDEVNRRGGNFERITVYKAIEDLCERGFLYREKLKSNGAIMYNAVAGMKTNITEKRA